MTDLSFLNMTLSEKNGESNGSISGLKKAKKVKCYRRPRKETRTTRFQASASTAIEKNTAKLKCIKKETKVKEMDIYKKS